MRQVIRKGLKEIIVDDVPDPIASAHHVVVQPQFSLISSGTETASIHTDSLFKELADNPSHLRKIMDVMRMQGPLRTASEVIAKFSEYAVLGYSGAGIVVEKHATVKGLEVGDRVAYGGEGTGHGERILTGENLVVRMPEGLGFDRAAFATLGSIALNAVRISAIGIGDRVAVIGQGLVGQLVTQLAKLQGAVVIAIDLKPERLELSRTLGADYTLLPDRDTATKIDSLTGGKGVDCAIVAAAAKSSAPCHQAVAITRDRGRIVVVGAVNMEFSWNEMYLKEIQLFMSRAYGPGSYDASYEKNGIDYPFAYVRWTENRNMEEFLRLMLAGKVAVDPLITHRYALEEAPQAYQTIMDPAKHSLAVLLRYPEGSNGQISRSDTPPRRRIEVTPPHPKNSDLEFALVGAGNLARWEHLPNIKRAGGVTLKAVHSSSGARGKSYSKRFGANYATTDYQEILGDKDIDAVVIVSRNSAHAAQAIAALEAGKHVFVEKPLALTEDECRSIHQAQMANHRWVTTGFNRRFAPYYVEIKKAIRGRASPAVINCRVNSPGISGNYWMADPAIGGAILGEACHFVDLMHWLLDSEIASVTAYSLPTDVPAPIGSNNIVASFLFADGSIGNLTYCTVGSKTSGGERVEVFSQGTGAMTQNFKKLELYGGTVRSQSKFWADKGYSLQMQDFIDAIRSQREPAVSLRDGIRATIGCLRMLDSARTRQPCEINLDAVLA